VFISDKEDKSLLSRVDDAARLCSLRHKPCFVGFLNEREQFLVDNHLSHSDVYITFYGGYENAARTVMCASEYETAFDEFPIEAIYFTYKKFDKLTHRDFLGSLMGLGIERSCVGDIIVSDGCAVCFVKSEIAEYVKSQVFKIGRTGVRIADKNDCEIDFEQHFEELSLIVSSMRLDVVVASITGLSREKTAGTILSGKISVNYTENKNVSYTLKENDVLTIRGKGKYIIKGQSGLTKKGRLKINAVNYR
jgi:RNA-binding protein YlmH